MNQHIKDIGFAVLLAVILVALVMLFTGCAEVEKRPVAVQVKTVETVKAVPVPCVTPDDIPARAATVMPDPSADVARKAAAAYVDMRNLYTENEQLRALLIQCTKGAIP
jgi:hypothetical protein